MRRPLPTLLRLVALALLALVPVVARAQVPGAGATDDSADASLSPWRGSSLSYGHNVSAVSLYKPADLTWNPYYGHRLTLHPEYHFTKDFFVWANVFLDQEFTDQDDATKKHDFFLGDTMIEGSWAGWKEPKTGIKIGGSLRAVLPTSAASRADTTELIVAPTVKLSRSFSFLGGFNLAYYARLSRFFHGYTTGQSAGPGILNCNDPVLCDNLRQSGVSNPAWGLTQGPMATLGVNDKLSFALVTGLGQSFVYPVAAGTVHTNTGDVVFQEGTSGFTRYSTLVTLSGNYQVNPIVGLSLGFFTFGSQLAPDSTYRNPLFNRLTTLFLEVSLDAERLYALVAKHP